MRPGDFSPGNLRRSIRSSRSDARFNEAGGFLPRKPIRLEVFVDVKHRRFNEAGGFLPRKPIRLEVFVDVKHRRFNEAGGFLPRKRGAQDRSPLLLALRLQ